MIPVIVPKAAGDYRRRMGSALIRLAALVAVLLMPFGMPAPALALPAPTASGHCDGHEQPAEEPAKAQAHCTACSALPALAAPPSQAAVLPSTPRMIARMDMKPETIPEIATPPPRLS